jgi:hypothetical protein
MRQHNPPGGESLLFVAQPNSAGNDGSVDLVLGELVECRQTETTEPATQHEGSRKLETIACVHADVCAHTRAHTSAPPHP